HMHACFGTPDVNLAECLLELFEQIVPDPAIGATNLAQMPLIAAAVEEIRKQGLLSPRVAVVEQDFDRHGRLDQLGWHDEEACSQAGADRFRECSEVNHAAAGVEPG